MDLDTIAVIVTIIVGVGTIYRGLHVDIVELNSRMSELNSHMSQEIADLRERMARLEGFIRHGTDS